MTNSGTRKYPTGCELSFFQSSSLAECAGSGCADRLTFAAFSDEVFGVFGTTEI